MRYFSYHATAKKLIAEGKLVSYCFVDQHKNISPALVLVFDDPVHPVMPIRRAHWDEYLGILPPGKQLYSD